MSRVTSLPQLQQSQRSSGKATFPGQGRTLQDDHNGVLLHNTSQNPRAVTHNQLESTKGTKIVGSLAVAGDIGGENEPGSCATTRTHDQFKNASDVHLSRGLAISGNISASGANALASVLAALQNPLLTPSSVESSSSSRESPQNIVSSPESMKDNPKILPPSTSAAALDSGSISANCANSASLQESTTAIALIPSDLKSEENITKHDSSIGGIKIGNKRRNYGFFKVIWRKLRKGSI